MTHVTYDYLINQICERDNKLEELHKVIINNEKIHKTIREGHFHNEVVALREQVANMADMEKHIRAELDKVIKRKNELEYKVRILREAIIGAKVSLDVSRNALDM